MKRVKELQDLAAGDRVWIGDGTQPKRKIVSVERVTNTQILADNDKFYKTNGRKVGASVFNNWSISGIATPSEIKAFEAKLAKERKECEAREEAQAKIEIQRIALTDMFLPDWNVVLRRDGERWELEIRELDDEAVIKIAKALRAVKLR